MNKWQRIMCAILPLALLASLGAARAQTPELAVIGGDGIPGATVTFAIELTGDTTAAGATADVDLRLPDGLEFEPPVTTHCRVADRLATTHQIGGRLVEPDLLTLAIFARGLVIAPLGDGEVASCDLRIRADAAPGIAPLLFEYVGRGSLRGVELPVEGIDGSVMVSVPTATAVPTAEPTAPAARCAGDCDGDGNVTVEEVVRAVQIVLGNAPPSDCAGAAGIAAGQPSISDVVTVVRELLSGCE